MANRKGSIRKLFVAPKCAYSQCENAVSKSNGQWAKYCCKDCGKAGGRERKIATFDKNFGTSNPSNRQNLIERRKAEYLKKYGVDNPQKSKEIRAKTEQTNLEKYGIPAAVAAPMVREKQKQTLIANYGVNNPLKSVEIQERVRKTNLEKYGVEWTTQDPEIRRKQEETCLTKYGTKSSLGNKDIHNKSRATLKDRYGVDNPTKNIEILEKALTSGKMVREYTMPSGKLIKLRGYEPYALDHLLSKYSENQIVYDIKQMPRITYTNGDKEHRYYPDFYIPADNLIVEVKSSYTFNASKKINLLKRDACVNAGYQYLFLIITPSTESVVVELVNS